MTGEARIGVRMSACLAMLLVLGAFSPASASLVFSGVSDNFGQGFGNQTLRTLVLTAATGGTEVGCVKWTGSADAYGGTCPGGISGNDQDNSKSATHTVNAVIANGITTADRLGIVFNAAEPGGNNITVNSFAVTFYQDNGSVIATYVYNVPPNNFCCNNQGTGGAGEIFRFDWDQAGWLQQNVWSGANFGLNRIGISANVSDAAGAADSWYLVTLPPLPVPEPAAFLTMGAGLLALGWCLRRRNRES